MLFEEKILRGSATLTLIEIKRDKPLILDTRDLKVSRVDASSDGTDWQPASLKLVRPDQDSRRAIDDLLPTNARQVRIRYETAPTASGLQWLTPQQTAGKKHPFLFTQSEAIHARSWIPTQDSPGRARDVLGEDSRPERDCAP